MERRRLQQQKLKQQQQRFCVSQEDLTETIAKITSQRRATQGNIFDLPTQPSVNTLTVPTVSQLIKDFEARVVSTPYESIQEIERPTNIKIIEETSHSQTNLDEIRAKEAQLNHALADLLSLSNVTDRSLSISSSSSRSFNPQRRRTSSVNDNMSSISTSIALLNDLLEKFESENKNETIKPINKFW